MEMQYRRLIVIVLSVGLALVWIVARLGSPIPMGLQQSGTAFSAGEHSVIMTYGYFGNGDKLAFAIIRTWPLETSPEMKDVDGRVDFNSGGTPFIRHNDGRYYPPDMSGTVYMFFGDELRTMSVEMDEHTDTVGLMLAEDIDGVWSHFQKFRTE